MTHSDRFGRCFPRRALASQERPDDSKRVTGISLKQMASESTLLQVPEHAAPIRVLVVDDNTIDAMVAQAAVQRAAFGPAEVQRADCLGAALAAADAGEF